MVEINEALTRKVAGLARLELTDAEVSTFTAQLGEVLKYVDQLQEVATAGIEPLTHPIKLETPLREDVAREFPRGADGRPKVLGSAPDVIDEGFKVPQIV
ncbi:MAG: Asp-tRNA(Asn)/Glu-tRNA(Gln) amidotransferase subunit GatC [Bdellovibrionota bacterium]